MAPVRRRSISVLVGDDDLAVLEAVVELVSGLATERRAMQVHRARTGGESLQILLSVPIDVSILDVHMPDMTGIEVVRRYIAGSLVAAPRQAPSRTPRRPVPAIFMSGQATPQIRAEVRDLGSRLLDKPLDPDDVRAAVNRVLAHLTD